MADKQDESRGESSAQGADDGVVRDRVRELTWDLLDEQISNDEFRLLENLLLSDRKARDTYLGCVQLQADLMSHFAGTAVAADSRVAAKPAVLAFLDADLPPFGFPTPSAGEATQ